MAERTRSFVWAEHHDYGIHGWKAVGTDFDPALEFGIAHDVLEHMDDTPGADAECQAIGALGYGRVLTGYYSDGQQAASFIRDDFETFFNNGMEDPSDLKEERLEMDE